MEILYTAVATADGGREGKVKTDDGKLDLSVSMPKALQGKDDGGTNPEQLFAAGYSACFDSALNLVARMQKLRIKSQITAKVSLGKNDAGGFGLAVELVGKIEGVDSSIAMELMNTAHQVCPYSNATRGNIEVVLSLAE